MSDTTPEERLTAALQQTPAEAYVSDGEALMGSAESMIDQYLEGEERTIQTIYHLQDAAHISLRKAAIEQQRIANLLALSTNREAGGRTRANALREAIAALGVNR